MRLRMEGGAAPEEWVGLLMQPESQLFCPSSLPSTPCLCQSPRTGHCKSGSTTHPCQLVGHPTHATWSRSKAPLVFHFFNGKMELVWRDVPGTCQPKCWRLKECTHSQV